MPRLIDADALMTELSTMYKEPTSTEDFMTIGYDEAIADVVVTAHRQPTVDAVEVVRCRDCEHYHKNVWGGEIGIGKPYDNIIVGHHGCDRWVKGDGKDMAYTSPNGFCFLGERKERWLN